jgi:hypothetical protein
MISEETATGWIVCMLTISIISAPLNIRILDLIHHDSGGPMFTWSLANVFGHGDKLLWWLSLLAAAVNRRTIPVRIGWHLAIFFGSSFVGVLGYLLALHFAKMLNIDIASNFPADGSAPPIVKVFVWLWAASMCGFSYITRVPRYKCPACAEKISVSG